MMEPRKVKGGPNGVGELMWWMAEVGRLIDDPEALAQALEIQAELDRQIRAAGRRLNGEGHSWAAIGRAIGTSDVGALKRFRREGGKINTRQPGFHPAAACQPGQCVMREGADVTSRRAS